MESESAKPEALLEDAGWIRRLAGSLIADEAAADDAAQDTWVAALRRPPNGDRSARPWLARVLRNFARQRTRSEGNRAAREERAARQDAQPSAEELILRAERQRELVSLVVELDEPYRSTILLRFFEGLSPAGIAELQGIRGATVRSRLQRGLARLRSKLETRHDGRDGHVDWVRGLAPLPVSLGPLGTGNGWESPTLGSGAETMVSGTKLLVAAGIALVGGAATVGVLQMRGGGESQAGPAGAELESAALAPIATGDTDGPAAEELEPANLVAASTTEGRLELDLPPAAPLRGTLVDEVDGLPLTDFELVLASADGARETLRTDEHGAFASRGAYADGTLSLDLVDHAANRVHIEENELKKNHLGPDEIVASNLSLQHVVGASSTELRVAAGPTYPLELVMEEEIDLRDATAVLRGQLSKKAGLDHALTVLRHGPERAWVRFGARTRDELASQRGYAIEVRDASGLWAGIGRADSTKGTQEPVRVEMFEHAILAGQVLTTEGKPVAGQDLVLNLGSEKEYKWRLHSGAPLQYRTHTDKDGKYRFRWVMPDSYQLALLIDGTQDFAERLQLHAGRRTHDLTVDPLETRAAIRGRITSRSGTSSPDVRVFLDHEGREEGARKSTSVRWEETNGGLVGTFEFLALPPGEYRIETRTDGFFALEPAELVVRAPQEIELSIDDHSQQSDLTYRAVDASTGKKIGHFQTRFVFDSESEAPIFRELSGEKGVVVVEGVPTGPEISWRVQAPGYQPVWGDRASFGGTNELELALQPGWGTVFVVYGRAHEQLEGAKVFLDDVLVGQTDAAGQLRHTQGTQPTKVRVEWSDGERNYREEFAELRELHPVITVIFEEGEVHKR